MKKIFVAGSTSYVGRHFVTEALKKGFGITAMTADRSKAKFEMHNHLQVLEGSMLNLYSVNTFMAGNDYVLSAIEDHDEFDPESNLIDFRVRATENLIEAARQQEIKKIITLLGAPLLKLHNGPRIIDQADPMPYLEVLGVSVEQARRMWESWKLLQESGLDVTAFCPAVITDHERTGDYQVKDDEFCDLLKYERVAIGDLVDAMLAEFEKDQHKGKLIGIKSNKVREAPSFAFSSLNVKW